MAAAMLAMSLGGCATRESVEQAQAAADSADRHAGTAQARADEAYGVGQNALGIGNQAMGVGTSAASAAHMANQKADANAAEVAKLKRQVAFLQSKVLPHKKKKKHHYKVHRTVQAGDRNS
jgi:hypothetical protein